MALQKFPGCIDIHVHLRDPGATHKEDFVTGSRAAVAGGFTYILDMPNNPIPTFTPQALENKIKRSKKLALCDIGFHYGTNGKNLETFPDAWENPQVFGLKLYCNHTTGEYLVDDPIVLDQVFAAWNSLKPILVHAEGEMIERVVNLAKKYSRRLHVCHVALTREVAMVKKARANGMAITAGVTPHHLFLTHQDIGKLGHYAFMKPPLGTQADQDGLWQGIEEGTIDLVETDHAPHTKEEKAGNKPMYGVPGLETALGLLWKAAHEKRLTRKKVIDLVYTQPKKIFAIPDQERTFIEVDPEKPYRAGSDGYETKCGWSPFDGWELYGRVQTVVWRGTRILHDTIIKGGRLET